MNTERTKEEKLRATTALCLACNAVIAVGINYPLGVPVPIAMELWCTNCHVINLYYRSPEK